jgi:hypothetical protein
MTEAEWLACTDPQRMLAFLRGKASDRKLRLFAVASCRRVLHLLADQCFRKAVTVAERFADGGALLSELADCLGGTQAAWGSLPWVSDPVGMLKALAVGSAAKSVYSTAASAPVDAMMVGDCAVTALGLAGEADSAGTSKTLTDAEEVFQCQLLRDLFGLLPFRPIHTDHSWRTPSVVALAQTAYEKRAFDRLPILADALEEAGCTNGDILSHCREPGEHVRGCWVVDLVLAKS